MKFLIPLVVLASVFLTKGAGIDWGGRIIQYTLGATNTIYLALSNSVWTGTNNIANSNTNQFLGLHATADAATAATTAVTATTANGLSTGASILTANGTMLTNNIVWQTADYNATVNDEFILLSGAHKVTMPSPSAVGQSGRMLWIQCTSAGTNAILPNGAETFSGNMGQGLAKLTNTAVGKGTLLFSNRTNWWYVQL